MDLEIGSKLMNHVPEEIVNMEDPRRFKYELRKIKKAFYTIIDEYLYVNY